MLAAAKHSWAAYETYAWPMDELMPLTNRGKNSFGGMAATLVDSLDTLWLLGMKDAFGRARDWVATSLRFDMCDPHAAAWMASYKAVCLCNRCSAYAP